MQLRTKSFWAVACLLSAIPAFAHDNANGTVAVAARYEFTISEDDGAPRQSPNWFVIRNENRIVTTAPEVGQQEIWNRESSSGAMSLQRVFHKARRVVAYTPGELSAMGATVSWESLGSIIDPRELHDLERIGEEDSVAGRAVLYRAVIGREKVEIAWLENVRLPARIERWGRNRHSVLRLAALGAPNQSPWTQLGEETHAEYQVIDVADFGDMDYDPFVREVEALDERTGRWSAGGHTHFH